MDILKIFNDKIKDLGDESVSKTLELPRQIVRQFVSGKKTPGYKTCQKILDLWGKEEVIEPAKDIGDGSSAEWFDADGILNGSYCPGEWSSKKKAWDGRDVCLCLPVYNDVPQAHYFSMLCTIAKYRMALRIEFRGEDSMITRYRNHLAKRFLATGASWSIWFDSDMVFPFGHSGVYSTMTNMRNVPDKFLGIHTIERLISRGRSVVGGLYWDRRGSGRLIAGGGPALLSPIPSDTLHPVNFAGTGCLAVHRQVFLDIATKFPETMSENAIGNECGFFTNIQLPERMMGEDESFAKRATDAGHPTFLDLGLLCGHISSGNIHGMPQNGSKI
jgi:hypothetical protein